MAMDSRLCGNDRLICGNDCLFSASIVWVLSGGVGWCRSALRSAPIVRASALVHENIPCARHPREGGDPFWVAKCRMTMDSRLCGNDGWICGNDCLFSACTVWVISGVFG